MVYGLEAFLVFPLAGLVLRFGCRSAGRTRGLLEVRRSVGPLSYHRGHPRCVEHLGLCSTAFALPRPLQRKERKSRRCPLRRPSGKTRRHRFRLSGSERQSYQSRPSLTGLCNCHCCCLFRQFNTSNLKFSVKGRGLSSSAIWRSRLYLCVCGKRKPRS